MTLEKERIINVLKQVVPEEDAERIIFYLQGKSNISEFIIAEELDLEIHRTRNILYKLLDVNLVSFKRKKDKIKGWYICYWDFNDTIVSHLEEKLRLETIQKLKNRLDNEAEGFFYMCKYAHVRQTFEDAFENNFKCPECGDLMNQVDNSRTIDFLKKRVADLEEEQAEFEKAKKIAVENAKIEAEKATQEAKTKPKEAPKRNLLVKAPKKVDKKETKEAPKEKSSTKKATPKKVSVKKSSTKKVATKKASPKKTTTKKSPAKKSTKKTTKQVTKKTPVKKTTKKVIKKSTKKTSTKKAPAKKKSFAKKIGGLFKK